MKKRGHFVLTFSSRARKKGIVSEYLPWILIALAVLVILMITLFVLKDKGVSLVDQIKGVFR
ncbi:MAG: hypothetical protein KKB79_01325 [Nanoarchaeota archaeon]|nr:hypothetical protein [Nanoarchaeota archaeon]